MRAVEARHKQASNRIKQPSSRANQRAVEAIRQAVDFYRMHIEDTRKNAIFMVGASVVRNQQRPHIDHQSYGGVNNKWIRKTTRFLEREAPCYVKSRQESVWHSRAGAVNFRRASVITKLGGREPCARATAKGPADDMKQQI